MNNTSITVALPLKKCTFTFQELYERSERSVCNSTSVEISPIFNFFRIFGFLLLFCLSIRLHLTFWGCFDWCNLSLKEVFGWWNVINSNFLAWRNNPLWHVFFFIPSSRWRGQKSLSIKTLCIFDMARDRNMELLTCSKVQNGKS